MTGGSDYDWGGQPRLESWRLRNVRSVRSADLRLGPLTVVLGANSTGKSTVLQSLLLLAQSAHTTGTGDIALNGQDVRLGHFSDLRSVAEGVTTLEVGGTLVQTSPVRGPRPEAQRELHRLGQEIADTTDLARELTARALDQQRWVERLRQQSVESLDALDQDLQSVERARAEAAERARAAEQAWAEAGARARAAEQAWAEAGARAGAAERARAEDAEQATAAERGQAEALRAEAARARAEALRAEAERARTEQLDLLNEASRLQTRRQELVDRWLNAAHVSLEAEAPAAALHRERSVALHLVLGDSTRARGYAAQREVSLRVEAAEAELDLRLSHSRMSAEGRRRLFAVDVGDDHFSGTEVEFRAGAPVFISVNVVGEEQFREWFDAMWAASRGRLPDSDSIPMALVLDLERAGQGLALAAALTLPSRRDKEPAGQPLEARMTSQRVARAVMASIEASERNQLYQAAATHYARLVEAPVRRIPLQEVGAASGGLGRPYRWYQPAADAWANYFRDRVRYLGPLRRPPAAVYSYEAPSSSTMPLGRDGELFAAVLHEKRDERGPWPRPAKMGEGEATLQQAVQEWLQAFGLAGSITVHSTGPAGLAPKADEHLMTAVGTGTSQVLPVVVLCLLARPGDTVLLEQPEEHLHPGSQQVLGDFLLAMARSGRRIVVETHSEYLVTRLRRRIAEDSSVTKYVALLFAERSTDGSTAFRTVRANDRGMIEDWPDGFFDQQASDLRALMDAAINRELDDIRD